MAFLVNFRLRSDSDRPESEASPTENGACAFKVKSAGSQKAFHFSTTKSLGSATSRVSRRGLGRCGQSPARRGALGRPRCPEPVPRPRGGSASRTPDSPLLGCGDSVGSRSGHVSGRGPAPAITRLFRSLDHGSAQTRVPSVHFPVGAGCPPSPSPSPPSPWVSQSGRPQPAQRILPADVIPLCRLAGVRVTGGGERVGDRGQWNEGRGSGQGERLGLVRLRLRGSCEPGTPTPPQ